MKQLAVLGSGTVAIGIALVVWSAFLPHHGSSVFGYVAGAFVLALGSYFLWGVFYLRRKGFESTTGGAVMGAPDVTVVHRGRLTTPLLVVISTIFGIVGLAFLVLGHLRPGGIDVLLAAFCLWLVRRRLGRA